MRALRKSPAGVLMILWAVGWTVAGVARLIDGPKLAMLSLDQVPFGAFQRVEVTLGLLIATAIGWAGVLMLRRDPRAVPLAIGGTSAFVLHRSVFTIAGLAQVDDAEAWLRALIHGGVLPDIACVAALAWFVARTASDPAPDDRRFPRVVDLALLVLVGREALHLMVSPIVPNSLSEVLNNLEAAPIDVVIGGMGMLIGMGAVAVGMARLAGARVIVPATSAVLTASMLYAFILLGTQTAWQSAQISGTATRLSLYAAGVVALVERGLLISALEHTKSDAE